MTKTKHIGWPFLAAAIFIMIYFMDIVWWHAVLVGFLASFYIRIEYTTTERYRPYIR